MRILRRDFVADAADVIVFAVADGSRRRLCALEFMYSGPSRRRDVVALPCRRAARGRVGRAVVCGAHTLSQMTLVPNCLASSESIVEMLKARFGGERIRTFPIW